MFLQPWQKIAQGFDETWNPVRGKLLERSQVNFYPDHRQTGEEMGAAINPGVDDIHALVETTDPLVHIYSALRSARRRVNPYSTIFPLSEVYWHPHSWVHELLSARRSFHPRSAVIIFNKHRTWLSVPHLSAGRQKNRDGRMCAHAATDQAGAL